MENQVLKTFVNLKAENRQLVSVVRIEPPAPFTYSSPIDFTDYTSPRIYAIIPCWQDKDGKLTSIRTGKVIQKITYHDQIRREGFGSGFDYDDIKIVYTRRWVPGKKKPEYFFTERLCRDCELVHFRAFGEEITELPRKKK